MTIFEKIKEEIMVDTMNVSYTNGGIAPLFKASKDARIVIVGQAPGRKAEETQMIWNDLSGDRLREWMGISRQVFYESDRIAHLPMDFYYPGKAKQGDLPPRKGFAVDLTIVVFILDTGLVHGLYPLLCPYGDSLGDNLISIPKSSVNDIAGGSTKGQRYQGVIGTHKPNA